VILDYHLSSQIISFKNKTSMARDNRNKRSQLTDTVDHHYKKKSRNIYLYADYINNNNNNNAYLPTASVSFGIRNTRTHMLSCAPNIYTLI
jgi:hypothetical protein